MGSSGSCFRAAANRCSASSRFPRNSAGRTRVVQRRHVSGAFPEPGLRRLFRAREVAAIDMEVLEVAGSSPRVRPQRLFVCDSRFFEPSDVHANRGHAVMSPLEIRSCGQHLFQRGDGFRVLEVLRRAPQDPRARQMSLRQHRVERQGPAAMVLRLLQPRALRVELEVHVHRHEGQEWHAPARIPGRARRRWTNVRRRSAACPADRRSSRAGPP